MTTHDAEEIAALERLSAGARLCFETDRTPQEQRDAALDAWCTIVALEPNILVPDCGYDRQQELCFDWSLDDGEETLHLAVEEDGVITWHYFNHELDLELRSDLGGNPENGYQLFVNRFRKKLPIVGKHARICDGPGTGAHGFVVGHRLEDGHVLVETRDGIKVVQPDWIR